MRTIIQRVSSASVIVNNITISEINFGYLILLGIENADTNEDASWLANKISNLRLFNDSQGIMNNSINDKEGDIIVVSQFTLHAKTKKVIVHLIFTQPNQISQFLFTNISKKNYKIQ